MPTLPTVCSYCRQAHPSSQSCRPSATARGYGSQWKTLRREALEMYGYQCAECGAPTTLVDHVDEIALGGDRLPSVESLQPLCPRHNTRKARRLRRG